MAERRRSKKWLWWVVLVVVAGGVAFGVWKAYFEGGEKHEVNEAKKEEVATEVKETEKKVAEKPQEGAATTEESEPEVNGKENVKQYEGEDPNGTGDLSGVITYAGVNGGVLMVRVNIDQYVTEGECRLVVTSNGAVMHREEAEIVSAVATASCAGFDVPVSEVGSGKLGLTVYVEGSGKSGEIEGEVEI